MAPNRSRKYYFALILVLACAVAANAQQPDDEEESQFRFRFVGPKVGNRIAAVAGVPGDPSTYYAGAASGGVWKSIDGGNRWTPVFDKQPAAAIGSLAVSPSDPSVVWAGTGEAWVIRDSDVMGNGIYKSTDAGKTWTNMGLQETGRIGRIVVHPTIQTSPLPALSAALPVRSRNAEYFAPSTAASIGSACSSPEKTWAAPGSPWIHTTRTRY